jgi:hypothetical protein
LFSHILLHQHYMTYYFFFKWITYILITADRTKPAAQKIIFFSLRKKICGKGLIFFI